MYISRYKSKGKDVFTTKFKAIHGCKVITGNRATEGKWLPTKQCGEYCTLLQCILLVLRVGKMR